VQPADVVVEVAGAALGRADEVAGTVVDAGAAAKEWLGRRVVVPRILSCGDCDGCRRGRVASCPSRRVRGALERTQAVPARWLTSVEPPLWPEGGELWQLAALADAALAPFTALSRAGVGPSDKVVVVGSDARAGFARAIVAAKGAALVDGETTPDGAVVLAAGPRDWPRALGRIAPGVTIALLDGTERAADGGAAAESAADLPRLVGAEAHVIGVVGGHPDLLPELVALVVRGQIRLADAVRRVSAADAHDARARYLAEGGPLPIVVA
jgi:D-arabinose 1-dehydrogenase-like Zn-dependent alcohol dehydrogenase